MTETGSTPDPSGQSGSDPATVSNPPATPTTPPAEGGEGTGEQRKYAGRFDSPEALEAAYQDQQRVISAKDAENQKLRQSTTPPAAPTPTPVDPEVEAAGRFVDERAKAILAPVLTQVEEIQMRGLYPDYDSLKGGIAETRAKYPNISLSDAYEIAKGKANFSKLSSVVASDAADGSSPQGRQGATGTVAQTGTQPQGAQTGLTPNDIMAMPAKEYQTFIASPAGVEYLRKRSVGEL